MLSLRKNNKGFTIIEVLIVLAIAGLIMLIVFLAVPALQRNSRNTQIRNSAAAMLGGVNEYVSNNNGQLPTGCSAFGADGTVTFLALTPSTAIVQAGYTGACSGATVLPATTGVINIRFGFKCNAAFNDVGTATNRAYIALYRIETGSATTAGQCIES